MTDIEYLQNYDGPELRIMEVCGTHTAAIFKNGIRRLISPGIRLVSGPGCPVCVTVPSYIDDCIRISLLPGHELVCFGDLLKIPGAGRTLSDAKGAGGRVRMVWSPFDAVSLAQSTPETTFVFAAIGFETTAPAFGLIIEEAEARGIRNLRLLTSLKSAVAAVEWICAAGEAIDAFLCPGHVSVVTGADAWAPLAEKYGKPFVVAGFEGEHLLAAIRVAAEAAAEGRGRELHPEAVAEAENTTVGRGRNLHPEAVATKGNQPGIVRNLYPEAVTAEGNWRALAVIDRYFDTGEAEWRGLGTVAGSGYYLKQEFSSYEAPGSGRPLRRDFPQRGESPSKGADPGDDSLPEGCRCGDVILGRIDPDACPLFGTACTPLHAVGPCMVSSEGACGVWFRGRQ